MERTPPGVVGGYPTALLALADRHLGASGGAGRLQHRASPACRADHSPCGGPQDPGQLWLGGPHGPWTSAAAGATVTQLQKSPINASAALPGNRSSSVATRCPRARTGGARAASGPRLHLRPRPCRGTWEPVPGKLALCAGGQRPSGGIGPLSADPTGSGAAAAEPCGSTAGADARTAARSTSSHTPPTSSAVRWNRVR
jgi:hypothetical protein